MDLRDELAYIRTYTLETPKNYQLWQHRQMIVARLSREDAVQELDVIRAQLTDDAKNIHCWQYRQWLLRTCALWGEEEWGFVHQLLKEDFYNNSAWNHRFFLLRHDGSATDEGEKYSHEMERVIGMIDGTNEDNESVWNYLAALWSKCSLECRMEGLRRIAHVVGDAEQSENWMYIRFMLIVEAEGKGDVLRVRLRHLHPISRPFWSAVTRLPPIHK